MTKLRVLAGPNANDLTVISHIVNTSKVHHIKSDRFEGVVSVHIKGFVGEDGTTNNTTYFDAEGRKGVTWSIQVMGRFLVDGLTSDDVLFGNTFDRPLKLPWGSGAALKFMNFVDPTLEHALDSEKPWALSPLLSTMPYLAITKSKNPPQFTENSTPFHGILKDSTTALHAVGVPSLKTSSARRTYFSNKVNRKKVPLESNDIVTTDFAYGFLQFPEIRLNLPGGISFDLMNYWDGQPVRFVCCERKRDGDDTSSASSIESEGKKSRRAALRGPGEPFWVVVFEAVMEDEEVTAPMPDARVPLEEQAHLKEDID